jgi:TatD DNase family protein
MGLYDIHAHLTHHQFQNDLPEVLTRVKAQGLTTIIANGLNPEDNQVVLQLAREHTWIRPALGLYPVDAVLPEMRRAGIEYPREGAEYPAEEAVAQVAQHVDEAFAIGEVGLDGYWVPEAFWLRQEQVFRSLVELALCHDKPLIVHTRKREPRAIEILEELRARRVVWHCFGGKLRLLARIVEMGHFFSIPANARRSETFTRMLKTMPRAKLLLETDSPYLGPRSGERNDPSTVAETVKYASELWQTTYEQALAQFEENYQSFFGCAP